VTKAYLFCTTHANAKFRGEKSSRPSGESKGQAQHRSARRGRPLPLCVPARRATTRKGEICTHSPWGTRVRRFLLDYLSELFLGWSNLLVTLITVVPFLVFIFFPQTREPFGLPRQYWLYVATAGLVVAQGRAHYKIRKKVTPRLEIVFEPTPPFLQENLVNEAEVANAVLRIFRVGLMNRGVPSIKDVHVWLVAIRGLDRPQELNFRPEFRPAEAQALSPEGLVVHSTPTPTAFVDIAAKRSAGHGSEYIELQYKNPFRPIPLQPDTRYQITLLATGEDVSPDQKEMLLWSDAHGVLHLELVGNGKRNS